MSAQVQQQAADGDSKPYIRRQPVGAPKTTLDTFPLQENPIGILKCHVLLTLDLTLGSANNQTGTNG